MPHWQLIVGYDGFMILEHDQLKLQNPSVTDAINHVKSLTHASFVRVQKGPGTFLQVARRKNDYFVEYRESAQQNLVQAQAPATLEQVIIVFRDYVQQPTTTKPKTLAELRWEPSLRYPNPTRESGFTNYIKRMVLRADLTADNQLLRRISAKDYMKAGPFSRLFTIVILLAVLLTFMFFVNLMLYMAFMVDPPRASGVVAIFIALAGSIFIAIVQARLRWTVRNFFTDFTQK